MQEAETTVVQVARVRFVSEDGHRLVVDLRGGGEATVDFLQPRFDFPVGSVVALRGGDGGIERLADDVWPALSSIGVVRVRKDGVTVVDPSGGLRKLTTTGDLDYRVGNTVEFNDATGVVAVLDEKPIRPLDLSDDGENDLGHFRASPDPNGVSFDDFGGLDEIVERARELIEVPLRHREQLSAIGARPIKGVLFTGLPGTGKTMLARIIANQAGATFYGISGPEIFSKWYGESEAVLRGIFTEAADQERSIIFFDEIDSVAGQRDDDAHEASRRVVAQLLALMDGFNPDDNIVVVAATNRPQDVDVALRRPGRFDWEIDFPLPRCADREKILRVSARKLQKSEPLPHAAVAVRTEGWSSAELAAIWSEAALLAVVDDRSVIVVEDYLGGWSRVAQQRQRVAAAQREAG